MALNIIQPYYNERGGKFWSIKIADFPDCVTSLLYSMEIKATQAQWKSPRNRGGRFPNYVLRVTQGVETRRRYGLKALNIAGTRGARNQNQYYAPDEGASSVLQPSFLSFVVPTYIVVLYACCCTTHISSLNIDRDLEGLYLRLLYYKLRLVHHIHAQSPPTT